MNEMTLEDLWSKYNVSTVFILPLYDRITKNIKASSTNVEYPFFQLCIEYGLINTYLLQDKKYQNRIVLKFDKKVYARDKKLTNSNYYSMQEILVDSPVYDKLTVDDKYVYIYLIVNHKWNDDVKLIMEGKYSEISLDFKNEIKLKQAEIPAISGNELAIFSTSMNLAFSIINKSIHIKDQIENSFDVTLDPKTDEFYKRFNNESENL